MDFRNNPFTPGNGLAPPELAGFDPLIADALSAIGRVKRRVFVRDTLIVGLRGTGKTALLRKLKVDAELLGALTVMAPSPQKMSLPALLVAALQIVLKKLTWLDDSTGRLVSAHRALAGFANLNTRFHDIDWQSQIKTEPGLADSSDLKKDLVDLLIAFGEATAERRTLIVVFIDELHDVVGVQLSALIGAIAAVKQKRLPFIIIGAGLPQLRATAMQDKWSTKLFKFVEIGRMAPVSVRTAVQNPIKQAGASISLRAYAAIARHAYGIPYFVQTWGRHSWDAAIGSVITLADVHAAAPIVSRALETNFFGIYFKNLNPGEKRYLRAIAELGSGPISTTDIAVKLGRALNSTQPMRSLLVTKGLLHSPERGMISFSIPYFDKYLNGTI